MELNCCFFGHRKIKVTDGLVETLTATIEDLIENKNVVNFYFGSKSQFDDLCHNVVTRLKQKYPYIKRIYVRAEYTFIGDDYKTYLLESFEETYYPKHMVDAGRAAYVERNQEIIKKSDYCVVYYDENYAPPRRRTSRRDLTDYQPKSGTKIAYEFAISKKKTVINLFKTKVSP